MSIPTNYNNLRYVVTIMRINHNIDRLQDKTSELSQRITMLAQGAFMLLSAMAIALAVLILI